MSKLSCDKDVCTKRGVLMACYVNGRKRFRAAMIDDMANPLPSQETTSSSTPTPSPAMNTPESKLRIIH